MPFILWTEITATVFCLALGFFVYRRNPKNPANRNFALFSLCLAVWAPSDLIKYFGDHRLALATYHLIYIGGSFITFTFMSFIWALTEQKPTRMYRLTKWLAVGFALLAQTSLLIQKIRLTVDQANPIEEIHGPLYPLFVVFFVLSLLYSVAPVMTSYRHSSGNKRKQLQYIMLAFAFGFVAVINFFASTVNNKVPPLFYLFITGIMITFAMAITRHKLMDIQIVIRQTLVYSLITVILATLMLFVGLLSAHVTEGLFGSHAIVLTAVTALLIAIVFHPLQIKIQSFVDRHLFPGWKDRDVAREIAAGFSHELKSPLATLSMQAQMSLFELEDLEKTKSWATLPKVKEQLQNLVRQTMETAKRVEAVRGVAEPAAGQVDAVWIPGVLENSLKGIEALVAESGAHVGVELPKSLPAVQSNAKQLDIVFTNLLKNSLEAMKNVPQRRLTIRGSQNKGSVFISIRDTGPGIKPEHQAQLFQAYFTTKGSKGTGMGLYLSRQIIEAHGGAIEVRSEEGKGSEFVVRLPRYS